MIPNIVIIDDMATEIHNKNFMQYIKKCRHASITNIASSQCFYDFASIFRQQADYIIIFNGMSINQLKNLYLECNLVCDFERFQQIYKLLKRYETLIIDKIENRIILNFEYLIVLE